ncbi:MAG TPA: peroxidase family protein [Polyangiaceae bacterium]|nr:peroxidase family protein [Polyangiaceae bacterium]
MFKAVTLLGCLVSSAPAYAAGPTCVAQSCGDGAVFLGSDRSLDGACNNLQQPDAGAVGDALLYRAGQHYARGPQQTLLFLAEQPHVAGQPNSFPYLPTAAAPAGTCGPPGAAVECEYSISVRELRGYGVQTPLNARVLSNALHSIESPLAPAAPTANAAGLTILWIRTSQIVAHDMQFLQPAVTLSRKRQGFPNQSDPMNATVLTGIPVLEPFDLFNVSPVYTPRGVPEPPIYRALVTEYPEPLLEGHGARTRVGFANSATAFIDGDTLYGRTPEVLDRLREHDGGRFLLESLQSPAVGPLPSFSISGLPPSLAQTGLRDPVLTDGTEPFTPSAADSRNLSTVGTVVASLIWTRLHNYMAGRCQADMGNSEQASDDALFACARRWTLAVYQHVVFDEFIPAMTGRPLPAYRGYRAWVNPQTSLESVIGPMSLHSTPGELAPIAGKDGAVDERLQVELPNQPSPPPGYFPFIGSLFPTPTASAGFYLALAGIPTPLGDPTQPGTEWALLEDPVAQIVRGLAFFAHEENDITVIDSQRNIPAGYGLDLVANNIARNLQLGVANYYQARSEFLHGLDARVYGSGGCPRSAEWDDASDDPPECFERITGDRARAELVRSLLQSPLLGVKAKVKHLPLMTGLLLEPRYASSLVGPTSRAIVEDQFTRVRDGDRFYYRNQMDADEVAWVEAFRMADVVRASIGADVGVQDDVFHVPPPAFFGRGQ